MKQDTLIDLIYRFSFTQHGRRIFKPSVQQALFKARRYILDDEMSAFMADLGWAAFRAYPDRVMETLEALQKSARLPFPVMWVEWNEVALAKRSRDMYDSDINPDKVPLKSGFLLIQHPKIETAALALSFGLGNARVKNGKFLNDLPNYAPSLSAIGFQWNTEGPILPFKLSSMVEEALLVLCKGDSSRVRNIQSASLTGVPAYQGRALNYADTSYYFDIRTLKPEDYLAMLSEHVGMMRYIFALLATITDVPVTHTEVRLAKGFVGQGSYRKYLDHHVISLKVPMNRYKALAKRAVTFARRKGHEVGGHFREHWQHPFKPGCNHLWVNLPRKDNEPDAHECVYCKGRRTWIKKHERGDPKLGWVTHDYSVGHRKAS